jgi:hypothetical protein
MKKSTLCIFLILWFCNFINTANAVIKKHAGVSQWSLADVLQALVSLNNISL